MRENISAGHESQKTLYHRQTASQTFHELRASVWGLQPTHTNGDASSAASMLLFDPGMCFTLLVTGTPSNLWEQTFGTLRDTCTCDRRVYASNYIYISHERRPAVYRATTIGLARGPDLLSQAAAQPSWVSNLPGPPASCSADLVKGIQWGTATSAYQVGDLVSVPPCS